MSNLTNKVFLGGLPGDILADEVKEAFKEYGKIENVEILYDKETKKCRGFGFITFDSPEPAEKVLALQHFSIAGKLVEVKSANPKVDRNKMNNHGHGGHGPPPMGGSSGMGPGSMPPSMPPGYPYPYPYPYPPPGGQQQRPDHGSRSPPHGPSSGMPPGMPPGGGQPPHPMYNPYYAMYYSGMAQHGGMPPGYSMPPGYPSSSSYSSSRHRSRSPRRSRSRSRSPRHRSPYRGRSPRRYARSRSRTPPYRAYSPHRAPAYPSGRSPGGRSPSPRRDYLAAYGSSMPVDYLYGRREKTERSPSPRRAPRSPPSSYNPY